MSDNEQFRSDFQIGIEEGRLRERLRIFAIVKHISIKYELDADVINAFVDEIRGIDE